MKTRTLEEVHAPAGIKPLRVLIVEHSSHDVELMLLELRQAELRVECTLVQDRDQFHTAIETESFDAILSGYWLPSWTGLDVLRDLRESGKDIPLLLITGTLGEEAAVECIKQGASDFILKEHLARLPGALKRAVQENALRRENALAQAALSKSESRLRCIIEAEPQYVKIVDRDGVLLEMNPAGLRMIGAENLEQVAGKPVYLLLCPEYQQKFRDLLTHVCQGGSGSLEYEIQGLKGVRRFLETHSSPFLDGHGEIVGALSVAQDITERKRTEEELRLSEARNCDLVENSVYGISRISENGKFLDANRALLKILGCMSFEDLQIMDIGRDIFRSPEQHTELMALCRERGQVHGAEAEWRRKTVASSLSVRMCGGFPYPIILTLSNASWKTSPSCGCSSGSYAKGKNLKPSASLPEESRTISTTLSAPFSAGPSWASSRAAAPRRLRSASRASASRPIAPRPSRANSWPSPGNRFCSRAPWI